LVEPFLVGPRVGLRPIEREELPRYRELSESVRLNLLAGGLGVSEGSGKLQRWFDAGEFDITDRYICLAIQAEGGVPIGDLALKNEENMPSRAASFGISIGDPDCVGSGYGAEASTLFLSYAFGVMGYHKVDLDFWEYNTRAQALYEKLGFVHEGRRRENHWSRGRFWDDVVLTGITAEEWWAKHGPPPQPEANLP
jgi:RimJ/RimL family protein N-acetyltransferase